MVQPPLCRSAAARARPSLWAASRISLRSFKRVDRSTNAVCINSVPCTRLSRCRLKRLGRGEKELARSDFQMIPELAGNPFLPRIFEMWVVGTRLENGSSKWGCMQQVPAPGLLRLLLSGSFTVPPNPPCLHTLPPAGSTRMAMATCMRGTCGRCWRAWAGWRGTRRSASSVSFSGAGPGCVWLRQVGV